MDPYELASLRERNVTELEEKGVTGIPKEKREMEMEKIFAEIMAEKFPNLMKTTKPRI